MRLFTDSTILFDHTATINWEYWNGTAWTALTVSLNNPFGAAGGGFQYIYWPVPTDWLSAKLDTISGIPAAAPSVANHFWARVRLSAVTPGSQGGANKTNYVMLQFLDLNGKFGPTSAAYQGGSLNLVYTNGMWREKSRYTPWLTGSIVWDPGSLADGVGETSSNITITGAEVGDRVDVFPPYNLQAICCTGYVSAANTVNIRLQNETTGTINLASGTWKAVVVKVPE